MPLILLEGPRRWAEEQLGQIAGEDPLTILPAETLEAGALTTEVCGGDLFASRRCFAVLDWELTNKAVRAEVARLYNPKTTEGPRADDSVTLVLRATGKDRKGIPADRTLGIADQKTPAILDQLMMSRGLVAPSNEVKKQLLAVLPEQYDEVADIADKASISPEKIISSAMVSGHGFLVEDSTVFRFMDALRSGNHAAIVREARLIAPAAPGELPRLVGGIAWALRRWIDQGSRPGPAKLRPLHHALSELDTMTKSSGLPERLLFERFVTRASEIMGAS